MIPISKDIFIQAITASDQPKLLNLMRRIYPPSYKYLWLNEDYSWYMNLCYSKLNLDKELNEKNAKYFFVYFRDILTGIIRFKFNTPLTKLETKKTTYIHRIYLGEESQGKGVGRALFNWIEKESITKRQKGIWLEAMDKQKQALQFYEKCGYKMINTKKLTFQRIHKTYRGMFVFYKSLS